MSEQEKETENPNEIVNLVENILEFNRQQQGLGLKILTLNQMLSRLPISLAQLRAGNNSEKLKNGIRPIVLSVQIKITYKATLWKFDWHYLKIGTIFMNSENSKTSESHRFSLDLTDKLNLKDSKKTWF